VRRPAPQASVGPSFLDVKSASRTLVDADQSTEIVGYVLALAMAPAPVSAVWMHCGSGCDGAVGNTL
jgi:hypothetical protein